MCTYKFHLNSFIILSQDIFALLSNPESILCRLVISMSLRLLTMLFFLIVLGGGGGGGVDGMCTKIPLNFGHWNLGGLSTDNFLRILLQAFLCVNDFDIVISDETHLCSKINENELNIEGYSFKHCDHPNDTSLFFLFMHFYSVTMTTHAESINSDLYPLRHGGRLGEALEYIIYIISSLFI